MPDVKVPLCRGWSTVLIARTKARKGSDPRPKGGGRTFITDKDMNMTFAELVAKLTEGAENIGDVAEFSKQLQAEHEKELGIRDAKIQTITSELATHEKQVVALKATNYDLLMATGVNGGDGDKPEPKPEPARDINSLFQPKEG